MSYSNLLTMSSIQTALDAPSLVFLPPAGTCSLRPSPCLQPQGQALGATLWAAVAVQIVCPDDLSLNHSYGYAFGPRIKYGAGSGTRWRHKSARSRFGRPQDARRGCAMEGAHQKSCAIIASPGKKSGLTRILHRQQAGIPAYCRAVDGIGLLCGKS